MVQKIIGCREYVDFPDWDVAGIEAKVDTGARTSALHVDNVHRISTNRVRFEVVLSRRDSDEKQPAEARIVRLTRVRSSTGHRQERYVVAARMRIGRIVRKIEVSLVCRRHMLCRMLLGRTAINGFLIDANERYMMGRPRKKKASKASR